MEVSRTPDFLWRFGGVALEADSRPAEVISLICNSAEQLDSVRIWPLIQTLASSSDRVEEPRVLYVT